MVPQTEVKTNYPFRMWVSTKNKRLRHNNREFVTSESKTEFLSVVQNFCMKLRQESSDKYDRINNEDIQTINSKLELNGHSTTLHGSIEFRTWANSEFAITTKDEFLALVESFCSYLEQEMDAQYDERKLACVGSDLLI
jgi:hypothetical protein